VIPCENPESAGERDIVVHIPFGPQRSFWWNTAARNFRSEGLLALLEVIPARTGGWSSF
jgi:hypothetical protein